MHNIFCVSNTTILVWVICVLCPKSVSSISDLYSYRVWFHWLKCLFVSFVIIFVSIHTIIKLMLRFFLFCFFGILAVVVTSLIWPNWYRFTSGLVSTIWIEYLAFFPSLVNITFIRMELLWVFRFQLHCKLVLLWDQKTTTRTINQMCYVFEIHYEKNSNNKNWPQTFFHSTCLDRR